MVTGGKSRAVCKSNLITSLLQNWNCGSTFHDRETLQNSVVQEKLKMGVSWRQGVVHISVIIFTLEET